MNLQMVFNFTLPDNLFDTVGQLIPHAQRWKAIQQGWNASASQNVNYVAWGLGIVVTAAAIFAIINARRESRKRHERELVYFERKAMEKELDKKHLQLLGEAIRVVGIDSPYRLLDSYDIFQHVLETYHQKCDFSEQEHKFFHQTVDEIKNLLGFTKIEETVQLQSSQEIHKGQIVRLVVEKTGQPYEYLSTLLFNTDQRLTFDANEIDFDFIRLNEATPIEVKFYRESDAGYQFVTTIAQAPDTEKKEIYLQHPKKFERVQARSFSRMEVKFRFSFYHLPKDKFDPVEIDQNLAACETLPVFMGETIDISGGGIALYTGKKVKKGDFLFLNFQQLSEEHSEPVLAEVVWCGTEKDKKTSIIRAKYHDISETSQDTLMKFIYQIQRKAARKLKYATRK